MLNSTCWEGGPAMGLQGSKLRTGQLSEPFIAPLVSRHRRCAGGLGIYQVPCCQAHAEPLAPSQQYSDCFSASNSADRCTQSRVLAQALACGERFEALPARLARAAEASSVCNKPPSKEPLADMGAMAQQESRIADEGSVGVLISTPPAISGNDVCDHARELPQLLERLGFHQRGPDDAERRQALRHAAKRVGRSLPYSADGLRSQEVARSRSPSGRVTTESLERNGYSSSSSCDSIRRNNISERKHTGSSGGDVASVNRQTERTASVLTDVPAEATQVAQATQGTQTKTSSSARAVRAPGRPPSACSLCAGLLSDSARQGSGNVVSSQRPRPHSAAAKINVASGNNHIAEVHCIRRSAGDQKSSRSRCIPKVPSGTSAPAALEACKNIAEKPALRRTTSRASTQRRNDHFTKPGGCFADYGKDMRLPSRRYVGLEGGEELRCTESRQSRCRRQTSHSNAGRRLASSGVSPDVSSIRTMPGVTTAFQEGSDTGGALSSPLRWKPSVGGRRRRVRRPHSSITATTASRVPCMETNSDTPASQQASVGLGAQDLVLSSASRTAPLIIPEVNVPRLPNALSHLGPLGLDEATMALESLVEETHRALVQDGFIDAGDLPGAGGLVLNSPSVTQAAAIQLEQSTGVALKFEPPIPSLDLVDKALSELQRGLEEIDSCLSFPSGVHHLAR